MTTTIDINQAQISQLVELAKAGQEVILAQDDKPLLRVTAVEAEKPVTKQRIGGLHRGMIQMSDDFDEPLPDSFWLGEE